MKAIRIKNLRSLVDSGLITLKPLSLLVGRNGAGKSSFLRIFPLLRQSAETRTRGPILWYGDYVDFGGINESINVNTENKEISFSILITLHPVDGYYDCLIEDLDVLVEITLSESHDHRTFVKKITAYLFEDDEITIVFSEYGFVEILLVNDLNLLKEPGRYFGYEDKFILPKLIAIKEVKATDPKNKKERKIWVYRDDADRKKYYLMQLIHCFMGERKKSLVTKLSIE